MKKYIEVNDIIFEVMKPIEKPTFRLRKNLLVCYKKPSFAKKCIYREWERFCFKYFDDVSNFGIESYNGFMFTLGWTTTGGEWYVTKTRQEFYPYK